MSEFCQWLKEEGVPVEDIIRKGFLGKEEMYLKYTKRFQTDENTRKLGEYLKGKQGVEAFRAAHTIKGVVENFGWRPLVPSVYPLVEKLRVYSELTGQMQVGVMEEWEEIDRLYQQLKWELERIIKRM